MRQREARDRGRMFTGLCVRPCRTDGRSQLPTTIAIGCFVRTGSDGTRTGSFERSATSTAEKAKAV